uniref:Uncharacterized protein n=1 Tax=Setaria italica TaxID=4555 RepID=K4A035_SETIT
MAGSTRVEMMTLFQSLLRSTNQFSNYNIREYTRRGRLPHGPRPRRCAGLAGGVRGRGEEAARGLEAADGGALRPPRPRA